MNKYLDKVDKGEYVIFLHNGYSPFSYGISVDPIQLNFSEYKILKQFLIKNGKDKFIENFENSNKYDLEFDPSISNILNRRILTLSPPDCVSYTSKEEELNCWQKKKILIKKLKSCDKISVRKR